MDLTISPIGLETAEKAACVPVPLIIEIDCQEFVETGRECSKTGIFGTNDGIQEMLKELNQLRYCNTSTLCNGTAHSVVKVALNIVEPLMWLRICPTHLMCLFNNGSELLHSNIVPYNTSRSTESTLANKN